jgi:drug/metabolite transporter (DMT)-like permease
MQNIFQSMKFPIHVLLFANGIISISLSILNKSIAVDFPFPCAVVIFQNLCAIVCTFILVKQNRELVRAFRLNHLFYSIPITVVFVFALWVSLFSLSTVNLTLYAVATYFRPVFSCALEFVIARTTIGRSRIFGLLLIVVGAIVASCNLSYAEFRGFRLALLNTVAVSFLSVLENYSMRKLKAEQTPIGVNLYRLVLSVPLLTAVAWFTESDLDWHSVSVPTIVLILASGVVCLFAGIVMYALQSVTTSTTILVAGAGYKLITSILSVFVHGHVPDAWVVLGYAVSSLGFFLYANEANRTAKQSATSKLGDTKLANSSLRKR